MDRRLYLQRAELVQVPRQDHCILQQRIPGFALYGVNNPYLSRRGC